MKHIKLLSLAAIAALFLSGCLAYTPVKWAAEDICQASDARKAVLAEEWVKATGGLMEPPKCKSTVTVTGDAE